MELENKIIKLYNGNIQSIKQRKILTLLKLVFIDKEVELDKILKLVPITADSIKKYVSDREEMLNYLSEQELDLFLSKINTIFENKNKKLKKLITLVLIDGETSAERLQKLTPISISTMRKYVNDKKQLLKYLSQQELELFLSKMNQILEPLSPKLEKLIKIILVDKETNLDKICNSIPITKATIKKYVEDKKEVLKYISEEEYEIFFNKINLMLNQEERELELEQLNIVKRIIDDIFNTRHKIKDICSNNFMCERIFLERFNNQEYMNKNFPVGTVEKAKAKIKENGVIRSKVPRDYFVVEDRINIYISKDDVYFLNQYDNKKLNYAACYLGTGANIEVLSKKFDTNVQAALAILSDLKLQYILKPEYYSTLKRLVQIEKALLDNNIIMKKQLMFGIIDFMKVNNYDKDLSIEYFQIPQNLFDRILLEAIKLPYIEQEVKIEIKKILNFESDKKVK